MLLSLPVELLALLFSFVDLRVFLRLSLVCKYLQEVVQDCKNRETLDFNSVKRSLDTALPTLLKRYRLGNIRSVKLEDSYKLDDKKLESICVAFSSSLQDLLLRNCSKIKQIQFISTCTNLERLDISGCTGISLSTLVPTFPISLHAIRLCSLSQVNDGTLRALTERCTSLDSIALDECYNCNDEAVAAIAKGCPNLQTLILSWCSNISNSALQSLANNTKDLQHLALEECHHITDEGITQLAKGCTNLTKLNLEQCFKITEKSLNSVVTNCIKIKEVNVRRCQNISSTAVVALLHQHRSLNILQ